jgi:chromosome segregation ATPase
MQIMLNFYIPSFFWDAGLVVLVMCAFAYTSMLTRKLSVFYKNRQDLERLLGAFSQSLASAESSLSQLRQKTTEFEESLTLKIRTATSLVDDLRFFSDRGEALVKELDREVRKARELKQELNKPEVEEDPFKKLSHKQGDSMQLLPSIKESGGFLQQATGLR